MMIQSQQRLLFAIFVATGLCQAFLPTTIVNPTATKAKLRKLPQTLTDGPSKVTPPVLFSTDGSNSDTGGAGSLSPTAKTNLKILGKLSLSGLLAYGYMQYYAWMAFGSFAYYFLSKTVRKQKIKGSETIGVAGILLGMVFMKKFLGPAKFLLELVVTSFFSYYFLALANNDGQQQSL